MGAGKNWTQAELDTLEAEWGVKSIPTIAKNLGRSEEAIMLKAGKLGLGAFLENAELISFNVFLHALGINGGYSWELNKLKKAGLRIHTKKVRNNSFRMVDIDEFWAFAEQNRHLFDFSKFERYALGAEPEWVEAKRSEDCRRALMVQPHNAKWTAAEDSLLRSLLRAHRYTWPEIAARLRRSEGAIQRRVNDLGIKERPLKADNHTLWTEEQLLTVGEMIKAGSSYETMSQEVGKSTKAIRGRVFNMYLTENLGKVSKLIGDGQWGDNRPDRKLSQKLHMTPEEKAQTKAEMSKLVGLLTYQIRKHFDDQDNWQRNMCQNWDKVKGCTVGGVDCDDCGHFIRLRPQYCIRCGATFYERLENRLCERCRVQRKKSAQRKYMRLKNIHARRNNDGV